MRKKNLVRGLAATGAAGVLAVGVATSAFAGPPFTVSVGGSTVAGTHAADAASTGTTTFSAGTSMTCTSVKLHGDVFSGTGLTSPADVTSSSSSEWAGCKGGPLSTALTATPSFPSAWTFTGTSGPDANGVTQGTLSGIQVHVQDTGTNGTLCHFDVGGTVQGTFNNNTQVLTVLPTGGTLTTSGVSCLFPVNATATFSGSFDITDPSTGAHYPVVVS